jgi:outer membrane immunogenic protein
LFPLLTDQSKLKSLASLTLRVGYAWDRFLLYVKGGGAWLQSDLSLQFAGNTFATDSETASVRRWTIGVGGEYAFPNWRSGFVEYDYYNLRGNRENLSCTVGDCPGIGFLPVTVTSNINVIKAGLNLRFGPGSRW